MKFVALALAAPILCGCGTKVPLLSTTVKDKVLVSDVHIGITCEITDAIHRIIQRANNTPHPERKRIDRFRGRGVKYALTLTVIEDSTVGFGLGTNSSANPNPGDSVLTVGSGLTRKTRIRCRIIRFWMPSFFVILKRDRDIRRSRLLVSTLRSFPGYFVW